MVSFFRIKALELRILGGISFSLVILGNLVKLVRIIKSKRGLGG